MDFILKELDGEAFKFIFIGKYFYTIITYKCLFKYVYIYICMYVRVYICIGTCFTNIYFRAWYK